ncbi:hypothetical protein SDJN03_06875, partial [Cucurbita argyrosperma subsp. sororia]
MIISGRDRVYYSISCRSQQDVERVLCDFIHCLVQLSFAFASLQVHVERGYIRTRPKHVLEGLMDDPN